MIYPYIFKDKNKWSVTYKLYCVRWTESFSEDGFLTRKAAKKAMTQKRIKQNELLNK